jgi:aldehyde dehydrogenase (NAD+)
MTLTRHLLHIDGADVPAGSGHYFESVDPSSGVPWARVAAADRGDVDRAVAAARRAFANEWRLMTPTRRGRLLMRLADQITARAEEIARLETRENGKLYREMLGHLRVVPEWLYYFGGLADKLQGSTIPVDRRDMLTYTLHEPLGVVAIISPWNSPVLITMMMAAAALAAGNCIVVKPSEFTSAGPLEVLRMAESVGFPPGVVNVVLGGPDVGAALVAHPDVAKVGFTGSSATGKRIAASVGERLAGCILELGGKSANIVFDDADPVAAEAGVLAGIFAATGQTCIAGSRLLLQERIYDTFLARLADRARRIKVGDPLDAATQMGPVANAPQLEKVASYVDAAKRAGADAIVGGTRLSIPGFERGYFYAPTILTGLDNSSEIAREEVFGPVLTVIPFKDDDDAVAIANDSRYGLAAGVWTSNLKRAHRAARELQAGTVWLNTYRAYSPAVPFGGYKESGVGRSNGIESMLEYTQTKAVWCELSDEIHDPFVIRS